MDEFFILFNLNSSTSNQPNPYHIWSLNGKRNWTPFLTQKITSILVHTGVPHRWSRADVRVHSTGADPPTTGSVVFIVPRSPADVLSDPRRTERLLAQLTGSHVSIREVRPYRLGDPELVAADLAPGASDVEK